MFALGRAPRNGPTLDLHPYIYILQCQKCLTPRALSPSRCSLASALDQHSTGLPPSPSPPPRPACGKLASSAEG
eukprot:5111194-Prymnesium_polylepis.1